MNSQDLPFYVPAAVIIVLTAAESIAKPAAGTAFTAVGTETGRFLKSQRLLIPTA
ncbi:MAG TPA: hypothetical protein VN952_02615 [Chthoniobacterales bacterium]|nr:hypothetical protein [Chthoniobacterales bacterium]